MTTEPLTADFTLEYAFKRSLGPVLGAFFGALRERTLLGVRAEDGRVLFPPQEHDPRSARPLEQLVPVCDVGTVQSHAWVSEPARKHPLTSPFAYALITLDGSDTAFLHVVSAASAEQVRTGMRVAARWAEERTGAITDIAYFEPISERHAQIAPRDVRGAPLELQKSPVRLDYTVVAPEALTRFLEGLRSGKIFGRKDPASGRVYCPPRAGSPTHGTDMGDYVEVHDHGTLTTFCVVNVAFEGQVMKVPYVYGAILLDGADTPFLHLIDAPPHQARMGLRLRANWKPAPERTGSFTDIACFVPSGEPDAAFERYREYL